MIDEQDLVYRLRKRAEIRRQIATRKSVQEGKADRMADLLDEAAKALENERLHTQFLAEDLEEIGEIVGCKDYNSYSEIIDVVKYWVEKSHVQDVVEPVPGEVK